MLIECIIKRPDGTRVQLDDKLYHFKPGPDAIDPRHLAEVLVKAHAERFLSISEGYRYAGEGEAPSASKPASESAPSGMPRTSVTHSAVYQLGDQEITLPELTIAAFKESGLTITQWNEQDDEDLYEQLDATLAELQVAAENQQSRKPPERGNVLQPQPEQGLGEEDDLEEEDDDPAGPDAGGTTDEQRQKAAQETAEADSRLKAEQEEADRLAAASKSTSAATDAQAAGTGMPSHEDLVAQYKSKMGRAPSSRLSDERIYELLKGEED